jgi:hypothetical protein
MTHTLHRSGTEESLSGDFVFLFMTAKGFNTTDSGPKFKKFFEIAQKNNAVNAGDASYGNQFAKGLDNILGNIKKDYMTAVHAVFDNEEDAAAMLKDVKEADLGVSLVISGIFDRVKGMCQKQGIHRHAATYSLGIWGKTEKLPPDEALDVITMCGHGMVSAGRVSFMADEIKAGRKTAEDAAKELASQCDCGVFNPARAAKLLAALAKK